MAVMTIRGWIGVAIALVAGAAAVIVWLARQPADTSVRTAPPTPTERTRVGSPVDLFAASAIGAPINPNERPMIANVQIADLDRDGLPDIVVCDAGRKQVSWIRQAPKGTFSEIPIAAVPAPAHVQVVDFDRDGDLDLLVADLGVLFPSNQRIGSVLWFENDGSQHFTVHHLADNIARVADAEAADLDHDGDLDVAVAGFGYDNGETSWLEHQEGNRFVQHILLRLSGPINALVDDLDHNGTPDIVALVSQEWEEIWAFQNDGHGMFTNKMLWGSTNADFGSSWMTLADVDHDGLNDLVFSNGDAFDYAPDNSRPWHGVQWLRNLGQMRFEFHRIGDLSGASSPQVADIDGDGDLDVVALSAYNDWSDPAAVHMAWFENDGHQQFTTHPLPTPLTHLITLAIGDIDGDGHPDLVTGAMHISPPYTNMSRVTLWRNGGRPAK